MIKLKSKKMFVRRILAFFGLTHSHLQNGVIQTFFLILRPFRICKSEKKCQNAFFHSFHTVVPPKTKRLQKNRIIRNAYGR